METFVWTPPSGNLKIFVSVSVAQSIRADLVFLEQDFNEPKRRKGISINH